jgi:hypothetical protein
LKKKKFEKCLGLALLTAYGPLIVCVSFAVSETGWFKDYNEVAPHSGLGMMCPLEYKKQIKLGA